MGTRKRKHDDIDQDGMIRLIEAIIKYSVRDYEQALRTGNKYWIADCEDFFRGEYFLTLTDLDGQALIEKVRRDHKEQLLMQSHEKHGSK